MPTYSAPIRDMLFVLTDLLDLHGCTEVRGCENLGRDVVAAILEEAARLAQQVLQPLNQSGDEEGCHLQDGVVTTPRGFKEAYRAYVDGGWNGLTGGPAHGGQGLPQVLGLAIAEMCGSANLAFSIYPGLTRAVIDALDAHGTTQQKRLFLPRLIDGRWSGTMNLTEPHCGTDLGLLRTKAEPRADGGYRITGTKIFISAGEHDLTENIIHMVLARIPGAPPGVKGISTFIVPKILVDANGGLGERNQVYCGAIEQKMGIHAASTCVLNYEGAVGFLIGREHQGLRTMFNMMNAARLAVGLQGLSLSEVAYQNAVSYAKQRLQGRSPSGPKAPDQPADPIIVHPDVRRMLMSVRAFNEGARAFGYWAGLQVDLATRHPDAALRQRAADLVALLTPVAKAYLTDKGFEAVNMALQCYGGHGYIREWGMEQFVRDARIAQIYEGANGIQALDLVARKLPADGGRSIGLFISLVREFCEDCAPRTGMTAFVAPLAAALGHLEQATAWLQSNAPGNPEHAGAGSMDYLHLMGLVALGYQWARMARVALERRAREDGNDAFLNNKLLTARFFMERLLPDTAAHLAKLQAGADAVMALDAEAF